MDDLTKVVKELYDEQKANDRRSIVVKTIQEHGATAHNGQADIYIPLDGMLMGISELKFKLVLDNGSYDSPGAVSVEHAKYGTQTYKTLTAWMNKYPLGSVALADDAWGAQSLVPGTLILNANKQYVPIESLKPGDKILAADGKTINTVASNKKTREKIWYVKTSAGEIRGTYGHRVFVKGRPTKLKDLKRRMVIDSPRVVGRQFRFSKEENSFLGAWYAAGDIVSLKNKKKIVRVHARTNEQIEFLRKLKIGLVEMKSSDGVGKMFYLEESEKRLYDFICKFKRRFPLLKYGSKRFLKAFLVLRRSAHDVLADSIAADKITLNYVQQLSRNVKQHYSLRKMIHGGSRFSLRKKQNYPLPGFVMESRPEGVERIVYHLNVWEDNHSYIAEGLAHHNCWDYAAAFWQSQCNRTLATGGNRGVKNSWIVSRTANAGTEFDLITDFNDIKRGDWVIWGGSETGHIAMAVQGANSGYVTCWSQNYSGQSYPLGGKVLSEDTISSKNFLGAFRYKVVPNWPDT